MRDNLGCDNVRVADTYDLGKHFIGEPGRAESEVEYNTKDAVWVQIQEGVLISTSGQVLVDGELATTSGKCKDGKTFVKSAEGTFPDKVLTVIVKIRQKRYYLADLVLLAFYPGQRMIRISLDYSENQYFNFRPVTKFDKKGKTVSGRLYKLALK
jgi:hypothetical protein